ncbi:MAG: L-lactate dehydrogenase [Xanthomonadaceae bacterium]|jgi:L-lactate dehydrogenase (cytochrome)|nr:L-lactate dehydrogenase [Xanthomonadaceae bacterium]
MPRLPLYPASSADHRERARRRLPGFLFDYLDGGAGDEQTLAVNPAGWAALALRQRVLVDVERLDTGSTLLGEPCALPLVLAPVGLAGLLARRGEVQAARAARTAGLPFTLSTVGLCGIDEVAAGSGTPPWFQLYMLRDRGLVAALLDAAWAAGCRTLVFTVDLPLPGPRRRDRRHGLGQPGLRPRLLKLAQTLARPGWVWDVALRGRPLAFGSLGAHVPAARDFEAFRHWVDAQFDPGASWDVIDWLRDRWPGRLVLKGLLDADDARRALDGGAEGLVVSNHGGRQLDGAAATARRLPAVVDAVGDRCEVLVDGGLRSGIDLFRALALGARGAMIGRPWAWALAAGGEAAVAALLAGWREELRATMALTGATSIAAIGRRHLDSD